LLGWRLNSGLALHAGVPGSVFTIYGACGLFAGALCVAPPVRFHRRVGGEAVVCVVLGLVPVLGAYLVQVGDITRKVYVAAAPLVVATALWVWLDEMLTRADDEKAGRRTMVMLIGPRLAGRVGVPALVLLLHASLSLAVSVGALAPWALAAWLTAPFAPAVLAATRGRDSATSPRTLLTISPYRVSISHGSRRPPPAGPPCPRPGTGRRSCP
jgi:1,4-dihydroxy-2-naphthoate octaprenyltransferase